MLGEATIFLMVATVMVVVASGPQFVRSVRLYRVRDRFKCVSCGNCCRFRVTPLLAGDVVRLESAGLSGFADRYGGEACMKRVRGRCMFLKDDRCSVYEHRPRVCRSFPFFSSCGIGYAERASFCPAMEELENGRR